MTSVWCQRNVGLADNADFMRSAQTFTSGPTGLPPGFPQNGSEAHRKRFFYYWLPQWDLHWSHQRPNTSADVLWAPGVLASAVGWGSGKVDLRVVSIFPKLLLLGQLLMIVAWAWRQPAHRGTLLLTLGLPAVLVFSTTDYLAYLQSFYQESASLVFLLPFLFSLVYFRRSPSRERLAVTLVCLALLATAKRSNFYWPLLACPFLLSAWLAVHPGYREARRRATVAVAGVAAGVIFTLAALEATHIGGTAINTYDSFFDGALTFSKHPAEHLARFGWQDSADGIRQAGFSPAGQRFLAGHETKLMHGYALLTYLREPGATWSAIGYVSGNMQDVSLEYLGKYALGDPRAAANVTPQLESSEGRVWIADPNRTLWNIWSAFKFHCFPTGWTLVLCLVGFAGWFAWQVRGPEGTMRELATVGLIATLACVLDMAVAILGDGRYELIKHLFLANLTFDLAAVVFLASVLVRAQTRFGPPPPAASIPTPP